VRALAVWCPEWAVAAHGLPGVLPVVAVSAGRVQACSPAALDSGVLPGARRREAQSLCPEVVVVERDLGLEARRFEPVVAAIERFGPKVEVRMPGECYMPTRGPSRFFGGDRALMEQVSAAVSAAAAGIGAAWSCCMVGVADGSFAARLAAATGAVVPPGESARFLEGFPVSVLGLPEMAGLLRRLGIETLGELARLPGKAVMDRFGPEGALAQRLAAGYDERPLATRAPPGDLSVSIELDPPVERLDAAAFSARSIAGDLSERLARSGLACSSVQVETETEHGEHMSRIWAHDGPMSPAALAERVRWQLEAWLGAGAEPRTGCGAVPRSASSAGAEHRAGVRPTAGITLVRLVPQEVEQLGGRQAGFWGGSAGIEERGSRALARVQGMLGHESVFTATIVGGRGPGERVRLLPWGERPRPGPALRPGSRRSKDPPWPGRVPSPAPAIVHNDPLPAELVGRDGDRVVVSGRGALSCAPARLSLQGGPWSEVARWAGPWTAEERWWDPRAHRRRARMQVVVEDGSAHLLVLEGGSWSVEATYD
jgi:protein ImuB